MIGTFRHLLSPSTWLVKQFVGVNTVQSDAFGNLTVSSGNRPLDRGKIVGAIDEPHDSRVSRITGQISGWVLCGTGQIDRVEVFVDALKVADARICLPSHGIRSDLEEAGVCRFQVNLHPDQMPADRDAIQVEFVAYTMCGESRRFAPRKMFLKQPGDADVSRITASLTNGAPLRRGNRAGKRIKVAVFAHELGYGGAQLYLQELLRQIAQRGDIDFVIRSPKDGPLRSELSSLGYPTEIHPGSSFSNAEAHDKETDAVGRWLLEHEFDCVIANTLIGFYAVNAAAAIGLPSIWAIHESFPLPTWSAFVTQESHVSGFLLQRIEIALRQCSNALFVSEATRRMFIDYDSDGRFLIMSYGVNNIAIEKFLQGFDRDGARDPAWNSDEH